MGSVCVFGVEKTDQSVFVWDCNRHFKTGRDKMKDAIHLLTYDIGTTGAKTCLFRLGETLELMDAEGVGFLATTILWQNRKHLASAFNEIQRCHWHPIAVNPTKQLAACANDRGWLLYRF